MSMIHKQKLTAKNLAAKRVNGGKSRGPARAAGKSNSGAARLLHGFHSRSRDEAMMALGEDPREYTDLLKSLLEDLQPKPGLQGQVVLRMGRALWGMQRGERMQDGLAVKRVQSGTRGEQMLVGPRVVAQYDLYERLLALCAALHRPDYLPSPAEIEEFEASFGDNPSAEIQNLFPLLRSLREAALKAPGAANEGGGGEPLAPAADEDKRESARKELEEALSKACFHHKRVLDALMEESDKVNSLGNIAALMAPTDENAKLVQRMEDSNLRQLWRLTRLFLSIKRSAPGEAESDENPC